MWLRLAIDPGQLASIKRVSNCFLLDTTTHWPKGIAKTSVRLLHGLIVLNSPMISTVWTTERGSGASVSITQLYWPPSWMFMSAKKRCNKNWKCCFIKTFRSSPERDVRLLLQLLAFLPLQHLFWPCSSRGSLTESIS